MERYRFIFLDVFWVESKCNISSFNSIKIFHYIFGANYLISCYL